MLWTSMMSLHAQYLQFTWHYRDDKNNLINFNFYPMLKPHSECMSSYASEYHNDCVSFFTVFLMDPGHPLQYLAICREHVILHNYICHI